MTLKDKIMELLGDQYKPSDEPLINELIYNFELLVKAKRGITEQGLVINTVRDPDRDPYYQKSPYFAIYDTVLKNINQLYTRLNISPLERRSWSVDAVKDDFDEDFS